MDNAAHAWDASREGKMRTVALVLLLAFASVMVRAGAARAANDDQEAAAERFFRLAERDEDKGAFAQAVNHHRACIAAAPGTRWAVRASERIGWLLARSEGGFAPLARLELVRRDPARANDPADIDALALAAEAFPPGTVRVEARMLVAEAWLGRMRRPRDAFAELRKVADDPQADALTASLAERELVEGLAEAGRLGDAAAEAHAHEKLLDPGVVRGVDVLVRRKWLRRTALALLMVFATLAAVSLMRARRRGALRDAGRALGAFAPVALSFTVFVAAAGGFLASRYESGNARPFLLFGVLALPLMLVARAWSAVGSPRPAARVVRASICAATLLGAAFVLLDVVSPEYLEGFGL
jgi:hypothetical protein